MPATRPRRALTNGVRVAWILLQVPLGTYAPSVRAFCGFICAGDSAWRLRKEGGVWHHGILTPSIMLHDDTEYGVCALSERDVPFVDPLWVMMMGMRTIINQLSSA